MRMIANYQLISEEQLNSLKNFNKEDDELFEEVKEVYSTILKCFRK